MDKWEKLKHKLKDEVERIDKMGYYEYIHSELSGAKDILKMMEQLELEEGK
jgi:hypothetical protein